MPAPPAEPCCLPQGRCHAAPCRLPPLCSITNVFSTLSNCWLQEWIEDLAGYVKSLDANHLVTLGSIGWYGASTPER